MAKSIPNGRINRSSKYPSTGIKSGIRSIGLAAYAATAKAMPFASKGVRGSRAAIYKATISRFSCHAHFLATDHI